MSQRIQGAFEVKMHPQPADEGASDGLGRMRLDKRYHGELAASGQGQMLAFRSAVAGSAGYVAMELVDGTLGGRRGSFVLQHSGTLDRGAAHLDLGVVPDSGTGELIGLRGRMNIVIAEGGKHRYDFEYELPEAP